MDDFNPKWMVKEHIIPASHPRGYRRGVRNPQTSRLRLHVKQYIPSRSKPLLDAEFAITLIVQHGMPPGDTKESYEPLMWDLVSQPGVPPIRAIWAMDIASSGQSFLLNRDEIGDEPHWFDSSRDLVQMVNYFQTEMRPPVIGIGQSWGASVLALCAAWNPKLFEGLVLSEPILENGWWRFHGPSRMAKAGEPTANPVSAGLARRKRYYASRDELKRAIERNPIWKGFDRRVLGQIMRYDYRDLEDGRVELITPPLLALGHFQRPSPPLPGYPVDDDYRNRPEEANFPPGFYNVVQLKVLEELANVSCMILFVWDKEGRFMGGERYRRRVVGAVNAKGEREGQIQQRWIEGGHSLAHLVPGRVAEEVCGWLKGVWEEWIEEERRREGDAKIDS